MASLPTRCAGSRSPGWARLRGREPAAGRGRAGVGRADVRGPGRAGEGDGSRGDPGDRGPGGSDSPEGLDPVGVEAGAPRLPGADGRPVEDAGHDRPLTGEREILPGRPERAGGADVRSDRLGAGRPRDPALGGLDPGLDGLARGEELGERDRALAVGGGELFELRPVAGEGGPLARRRRGATAPARAAAISGVSRRYRTASAMSASSGSAMIAIRPQPGRPGPLAQT